MDRLQHWVYRMEVELKKGVDRDEKRQEPHGPTD